MIDLDEIEARANAATPGPWYGNRNSGVYAVNVGLVVGTGCGYCTKSRLTHEDAAFIAAARTDVSALIARVRELETHLRIERENVAELEERLVLCQRTNDRMREQLGHKPPPWGMNK